MKTLIGLVLVFACMLPVLVWHLLSTPTPQHSIAPLPTITSATGSSGEILDGISTDRP